MKGKKKHERNTSCRFFKRVGGFCHSSDKWTYPEEPVLLQTPSKGRLSAKLSVFTAAEEKREELLDKK